MTTAVRADGVRKEFGDTVALDGVDLEVGEGTIFGLLGPNGAGKTTIVKVLTTLLVPDAGHAEVFGHDVVDEPRVVRRLIGLTGQYAAVDELLTGRENLRMFGRLFHVETGETKRRAEELLARFELTEAGDRTVKTYSGGMRRRLDLASSLVTRPRLLFLDEPTTGLDPRSRRQMWEIIRDLVEEGSTLLLTTQYLEEADELADRIAVIDHGRIIARGTADELKDQIGGRVVMVQLRHEDDRQRAIRALAEIGCGDPYEARQRRLTLPAYDGGVELVEQAAKALRTAGVEALDLGLRRPTLDDVFLELTGQRPAGDGQSDRDVGQPTHQDHPGDHDSTEEPQRASWIDPAGQTRRERTR